MMVLHKSQLIRLCESLRASVMEDNMDSGARLPEFKFWFGLFLAV
jgi:hypothetical protein